MAFVSACTTTFPVAQLPSTLTVSIGVPPIAPSVIANPKISIPLMPSEAQAIQEKTPPETVIQVGDPAYMDILDLLTKEREGWSFSIASYVPSSCRLTGIGADIEVYSNGFVVANMNGSQIIKQVPGLYEIVQHSVLARQWPQLPFTTGATKSPGP